MNSSGYWKFGYYWISLMRRFSFIRFFWNSIDFEVLGLSILWSSWTTLSMEQWGKRHFNPSIARQMSWNSKEGYLLSWVSKLWPILIIFWAITIIIVLLELFYFSLSLRHFWDLLFFSYLFLTHSFLITESGLHVLDLLLFWNIRLQFFSCNLAKTNIIIIEKLVLFVITE